MAKTGSSSVKTVSAFCGGETPGQEAVGSKEHDTNCRTALGSLLPRLLQRARFALLRRRQGKALSLFLAALLGLGVALLVYPPAFIAGDAARFHSLTLHANDAVEYIMAWRGLAEYGEPWPSLKSAIFNHPQGASIALQDGLPLAATVFRPLLRHLPEEFHYFGWWTALAVVLQGVGGVALLRAAGVRGVLAGLCAAALALAMPVFVGRLVQSHVALGAQWLLLLAIALCVLATRQPLALGRAFLAGAPLTLGAVAVHPLLGLQVLVFALTALWLAAARWPRRVAAGALLCGMFAAACAWLGLFDVASFGNRVALGSFGFSPWAMIVGEPDHVRAVYRSQGVEQDAWLGWGCVLLLFSSVLFRPRARIANTPLAWVVLLLALVAVSPWWRHGMRVIDWSVLLPDFVVDLYAVHRATVRLAWPLVMCLTVLPLAHILRTWPRRRAAVVIGLALPLQALAAYPYWAAEAAQARLAYQHPAPPPAMMAGATRLIAVRGAGGEAMGRGHWRYAMHLALATGAPIDGGLFARPPNVDAAARQRVLEQSPRRGGVRYVAPAPADGPLPARLPPLPLRLDCARWEILLVCRPAAPAGAP